MRKAHNHEERVAIVRRVVGGMLIAVALAVMLYAIVRGIPSATGIEREPAEEAPLEHPRH
jgi:hypothetical protein